MARPFLTNIDEANTQLNAALDKVDAHAGLINAEKLATTAATERAMKAEKDLTDAGITHAAALKAANDRADKAEFDLKAAKSATVTGAAAPGVTPVADVTKPEPVAGAAKTELTGRARTTAAFGAMQPAGMGRK